MAASLVPHVSKTKVSSVLNRDVKQFGKQYLFDGQDETCWNSDQGTPQAILLEFSTPVEVSEVHIQFQGGFAGKECWMEAGDTGGDGTLRKICDFYPEDINSLQIFPLTESAATTMLKIVFNTSTDFFGRIVVYKLDVLGSGQ